MMTPVRELERRLNADQVDYVCLSGLCAHTHEPITLPAGVVACQATDFRAGRRVTVLVRFARRHVGSVAGGWYVVRADTGRRLGWAVRQEHGERAGTWSVHLDQAAFRGAGCDDTGDLLDRVEPRLYNGDPHNSLLAREIGHTRTREAAAEAIVARLVGEAAPAVGFGRHPGVARWVERSRR